MSGYGDGQNDDDVVLKSDGGNNNDNSGKYYRHLGCWHHNYCCQYIYPYFYHY